MSVALKPGDRVRVTVKDLLNRFQPGDKGTVQRVMETSVDARYYAGARYYTVAMDKAGPNGSTVIFAESEIEADV